jgi:uncharacterized protein YecA (UPF0149 family)
VESGDKPTLNIRTLYRKLVQGIEATHQSGAYHVATTLLSVDGNRQEEIEEWFHKYDEIGRKDGEAHTLTLLSRSALPPFVFCVTQSPAEKGLSQYTEYCEMKRVQTDAPELVLVAAQGANLATLEFKIFEGAVKGTAKVEAKLDGFRDAKMRRHLAEKGKPGRNDLCPCNSGKKFKKCCVPRL